MTENILIALKQLDVSKDDNWTEDGLPRMDVVKQLSGDSSLTREAVTAAAPGFTRATAAAPAPAAPAPQVQPPWAAPQASTAPPAPPVVPSVETSHANQGSAGAGDTYDQDEPESHEDSLARRLQEAKWRVADAKEAKTKTDQEYAAAIAALDDVIRETEKETPAHTLNANLQHYFQSQANIRNQRAARIDELKGVPLKDILPSRSQIDMAMARKNKRGAARPTFPQHNPSK